MKDHVYWLLELTILPGQADAFNAVMRDMVTSTRDTEPGVLAYQWNISDDGTTCHIYERYKDSAAVLTHLAAFGKNFAGRFMAAVKPTRFTVYGSPSPEVQQGLSVLGPVFFKPLDGFRR